MSRLTLLAAVMTAIFCSSPLSAQIIPISGNAACAQSGFVNLSHMLPNGTFETTCVSMTCPFDSASATGRNSMAIGLRSVANGDRSTAFGDTATATAADSLAVGASANAAAAGSVAVGAGAVVQPGATGSVALGSGSVATAPNTVSVGAAGAERRITNVAAGTAATDAVNLAQLQRLETAQGALAGQVGELIESSRADRRDMRQGIASAVAIGSAPMPSAPGRTSYVFNIATFRGEQALGGSIMHRLRTAAPFALSAGFSYAGNRNNAARIGIAGEF